jgi:hypothetical protein
MILKERNLFSMYINAFIQDLGSLIALIHEDSLSELSLHQVSQAFQTLLHIQKLHVKQQAYDYTIKVTHRSLRNGKISNTVCIH